LKSIRRKTMNKLNYRHTTAAVVAAVLLGACGTGGGSSAEAPPPSGTGTTVTVTAVPSYVNGLIATTSDSSTPVDANLVILAEDDTGEPAVVN
jgi:hypothetical protein